MTQLFIDGMEAVLPQGFKCKTISENPLFTKASDYTLDITLSLENPVNARIYKHINRINSLSRFENRSAILISDNEVVIKGIEIILSYSDKIINIQIAAGNSSLNYLIGNDLELRSLNLGKAVINKSLITSNLNLDYPSVDYQLLPFYDPDKAFLGNRYTYYKQTNGDYRLKYGYDGSELIVLNFWYGWNEIGLPIFPGFDITKLILKYENYRPQPYFCAIIDKVFTALGYTIENDIATHDIYRYLYIVHAYDTLYFAKMLPDWTVQKFFEEIENLFDCTIIVDNNKMHARLVMNHLIYKNAKENNVTMLDDFETEIEDDNEKMQYEKNISYNLPDSDYYNYQNLPNNIVRDETIIQPTGTNDNSNIELIARDFLSLTPAYVKADGYYFRKSNKLLFTQYEIDKKIVPKVVNDYLPVFNNEESDSIDISIDIVPAEFEVRKYFVRSYNSASTKTWMDLQLPIAYCEEEPAMSGVDNEGNGVKPMVQDYVEGGESINEETVEKSKTQMKLAFYKSGSKWSWVNGENLNASFDPMPLSYVRHISEGLRSTDQRFVPIVTYNGNYVNPLSLHFLNEELYSKGDRVDRSKIYKVKFLNNFKKMDPKDIYIIGNRKFYCLKLERTITMNGFDEIIEGEFYAEKD